MKRYRVHIGYFQDGRERFAYFGTLDAARAYASRVFDKTGRVVAIEECRV